MDNTLSKGKEIKIPGPDHPITISPTEGKVRVTVAGRIVAESTRALRLEEKGYPPVYYLPRIKAGKWHTFSGSEHIVDGMQIVPLHGHTPGHTGYEFSSQGKSILFWGDIIHAQRVQLQHPEVTVILDGDPATAAATRNQLLPKVASEGILIAGPHMLFPGLGRLHKEGTGYSWAPVAFTDKWEDK